MLGHRYCEDRRSVSSLPKGLTDNVAVSGQRANSGGRFHELSLFRSTESYRLGLRVKMS